MAGPWGTGTVRTPKILQRKILGLYSTNVAEIVCDHLRLRAHENAISISDRYIPTVQALRLFGLPNPRSGPSDLACVRTFVVSGRGAEHIAIDFLIAQLSHDWTDYDFLSYPE